MTETHLIDETGRTVFRGTQSPGGGSLPDGWAANDPDPGVLSAHGGGLDMGTGAITAAAVSASTDAGSLDIDTGGGTIHGGTSGAIEEFQRVSLGANSGSPASFAFDATPGSEHVTYFGNGPLTLDGGGVDMNGNPIVNLPTSDPGVAGALWNDGGTPAISTG